MWYINDNKTTDYASLNGYDSAKFKDITGFRLTKTMVCTDAAKLKYQQTESLSQYYKDSVDIGNNISVCALQVTETNYQNILEEAKLWISQNNLTNYIFPLYYEASTSSTFNTIKQYIKASNIIVDLYIKCTGTNEITLEHLTTVNQHFTKCKYFTIVSEAPLSLDEAFRQNSSITEANIYASSSLSMTRGFSSSTINSLTINCATASIESICEEAASLTSLSLTFDNSSSLIAAPNAFKNCVLLSNLNVNYTGSLNGSSIDNMFYGCHKAITSHNVIKNFYGDAYNSLWVAGENRTVFMNCPFNGTVLDSYMSYAQQKAAKFDPALLMQAVMKSQSISYDPGWENVNHVKHIWTDYKDDVLALGDTHTLKAVATQKSYGTDASVIYIDGTALFSNANVKGIYIVIINPKNPNALEYTTSFDSATTTSNFSDLYDKLQDSISLKNMLEIITTQMKAKNMTDRMIILISHETYTLSKEDSSYLNTMFGSSIPAKTDSTNKAFVIITKLNDDSIVEAGPASGTNIVVASRKFISSGFITSDTVDDQLNGIYSPSYKSDSFSSAYNQYCKLEMPGEATSFWKWKYLFENLTSLFNSCSFPETTEDFAVSLLTDGSESEINSNSSTSFSKMANTYGRTFEYHIGNLESTKSFDASYMFKDMQSIEDIDLTLSNVEDASLMFANTGVQNATIRASGTLVADSMFKDCTSLQSATITSDTITSAAHMFENDTSLKTVGVYGMTALKDMSSMFKNTAGAPLFASDDWKNIKLPDTVEVASYAFENAGITKISGNWVEPNESLTNQNWTMYNGVPVRDWEDTISIDGWSFPKSLVSAEYMFKGNPLTKVENLQVYPTMNCSYLFADADSISVDFNKVWLNVDTYTKNKYLGIFSGTTVYGSSRIWLPIDISSSFDLNYTNVMDNNLYKFYVNDGWASVDKAEFNESQKERRSIYLAALKAGTSEHSDDIYLDWYSNIHIHTATYQGYNELHDAKAFVWNQQKNVVKRQRLAVPDGITLPDWYGVDMEKTEAFDRKLYGYVTPSEAYDNTDVKKNTIKGAESSTEYTGKVPDGTNIQILNAADSLNKPYVYQYLNTHFDYETLQGLTYKILSKYANEEKNN